MRNEFFIFTGWLSRDVIGIDLYRMIKDKPTFVSRKLASVKSAKHHESSELLHVAKSNFGEFKNLNPLRGYFLGEKIVLIAVLNEIQIHYMENGCSMQQVDQIALHDGRNDFIVDMDMRGGFLASVGNKDNTVTLLESHNYFKAKALI